MTLERANDRSDGIASAIRFFIPPACCLALLALCGADWPQFRGADSNGVAAGQNFPASWTNTENVAWKADLPGRGPSSPIVVDGRVIVTASSGAKQDRLHVLAFDAASGKKLWERQFWATGRTLSHPSSANAAPTPASDGRRIFAFYSSNDLVCLTLDGDLVWLRGLGYDFPRAANDVGMSSSPVASGDIVIVQAESQGDSFAAGIDTSNGSTRWRIEREQAPSWASPVVMRGSTPKEDVLLLESPRRLTAHEASTGRQLWVHEAACDGISSPTAVGGLAYLPSKGITVLRPPANGSEPEVVWQSASIQPGAASPLVHDGAVYAINRSGVLVSGDAATGELLWRVRLAEGEYWSSPVLAGGRLYCFAKSGTATIVQIGSGRTKGEIVGKGTLGEMIQCSPAVADGALFIRSDGHLWRISAR